MENNTKKYAYNPSKISYYGLILKVFKICFSYFENGFTFVTTMILSFNCYYDGLMMSNEKWKIAASIVIFISLFTTLSLNFMFFSNFIFFNRIENGKEPLEVRHFLIIRTLYLNKVPRYGSCFLAMIFNNFIPIILGILDVLLYCSSSNIRLLMRIYCIKDGKTHEEVKEKYKATYKIIFIGLFFLDIPTTVISFMILSSQNKRIIDDNLSSTNLSAIYCLCRVLLTTIGQIYSILDGMGLIDNIKKYFSKDKDLEKSLVSNDNNYN